MRIIIVFFSLIFVFVNVALAEEATTEGNQAPVVEPVTQDINARLQRVEKFLDNKALLDMLEVLESLKVEVNTLRGEIEVQTHTIEQLKQKQRDLYTDVDQRLQRMESNSTDTLTTQTVESIPIPPEDNNDNQDNIADSDAAIPEENLAASAEVREPVDPLKAEAVYQRAFKLLKESQYDQAIKAFKNFLADYPDSAYSDNAQYWMGEANYVMQKYELAINEYQALLNTYPDSQKVSHALLKIGYSYAELGNSADAKKTLKEVKKQYPGTTAARLADERLRKISSSESNT
ncbi:MAG: tol-pal system protein YbgF [Proteobacteria bacterium]|nr:tol-pal system protein YbgF [Pseudomonadota bacterium]